MDTIDEIEVIARAALRDRDAALAEVARLTAELADRDDDYRKVVAGDCAPDERHCSCVPHLRTALDAAELACGEIAYLYAEAEAALTAAGVVSDLVSEGVFALAKERDEARVHGLAWEYLQAERLCPASEMDDSASVAALDAWRAWQDAGRPLLATDDDATTPTVGASVKKS